MAERLWDYNPGYDWDEEHDLKDHPTWICDQVHSWPRLMPMDAWFWERYCTYGDVYGYDLICLPRVKGMIRRVRNGADYLAFKVISDEKEVEQREIKFKETVLSLSTEFPQWWPRAKEELMEMFTRLKKVDLDAASNIELLDHLYDLMDLDRRVWKIHSKGLKTVIAAWSLFENLCKELWGLTDTSPEFRRLMSGYDNKMLQVDKRLWQLAKSADSKGLADIIMADIDTTTALQKIEQSPTGRDWLKDFNDFLNEDGWRMAHAHVFHEPTWLEDPTPAIGRLKYFIQNAGEFGADIERPRLTKEREETLAGLLSKVPNERKGEFLKLLASAQLAGVFQEEHTYYCEFYCHAVIRRSLLGIGRRLVKTEVIDRPDDVFTLNPEEVERVITGPDGCDLRYITVRRRREWEEWHKMDLPPVITSRSSIPEAFEKDIMVTREPTTLKVIAGVLPEVTPDPEADLYGVPASSGVAEGLARVVIRAEDIITIQVGDILVAPSTTPTWTAVFTVVAGLVTEAGGTLSHSAIVAREYRLPAVVNCPEATKKIRTGQRIRVDGDKGTVYILP